MNRKSIHMALTYCFALVWLINGLFCKVWDLVPRHKQIVARIIGGQHAGALTIVIGLLEVGMAVWIISGYRKKLCVITQFATVAIMNGIEFVAASDLLLWGKFNALFAFFFLMLVVLHAFYGTKTD
jgi:hypothetical protein